MRLHRDKKVSKDGQIPVQHSGLEMKTLAHFSLDYATQWDIEICVRPFCMGLFILLGKIREVVFTGGSLMFLNSLLKGSCMATRYMTLHCSSRKNAFQSSRLRKNVCSDTAVR